MRETRDIRALVAEHELLSTLSASTVAELSGCARNVSFREGSYLFREGEPADVLYLLRHGRVALEFQVPPREPRRLLTLEGGDLLGWSWLVPPYRWTCDARALSHVRALSFDAVCLRNHCDDDPHLGYELMRLCLDIAASRLYETRIQLLDLYGGPDGG